AADPRQRLDGRPGRVQGPPPEHRCRTHRRGLVPGVVRPLRHRGRAVHPGDPRLPGGRQPGRRPAQEVARAGELSRTLSEATTRRLATLALLAMTACWGSTF